MDNFNASAFEYKEESYELEFENILTGITSCYKTMIANGDIVSNAEEKIRDVLYNKYLNDNSVRKQIGLYFNIVCEPAEYINGVLSGYIDLRIFSRNSLIDTSAYYIIECKRLDNRNLIGTTGLNAEYIKNGIMRFVTGQYSTYKNLNGMIGFIIERMDITANIQNINKLLEDFFPNANTEVVLNSLTFIKDFQYAYSSIHRININNKKIKLYHLMFDFSKNLKNKE